MSVSTRSARTEARPLRGLLAAIILAASGCHASTTPTSTSAPGSAPPSRPSAVASAAANGPPLDAGTPSPDAGAPSERFACNLVLGLAVTSEWYGAGFEKLVPDERWEALTKPHTFVEHWGDAGHPVWQEPLVSPCSEHASEPDRVLFFAANWTFTTPAEWEPALARVVELLRQKYPKLRRIELLSMVRAPGNQSCGNPKGVVEPLVDASIAAVSTRFPGLVTLGPRFEVKSCDEFEKGGPHFTEAGRASVAKLIAEHYAREP